MDRWKRIPRIAERPAACVIGSVARGEANEMRDVDCPVSMVVRQESAEPACRLKISRSCSG
jgi:hypothetical protein